MRLDLLHYGVVDGLAPQGRCVLHIHDEEQVAINRAVTPSVRWAPFTEKLLRRVNPRSEQPVDDDGRYTSQANFKYVADPGSAASPAAKVALFGAEIAPHPLLPTMRQVDFIGEEDEGAEGRAEAQGGEYDACTHYQCIATHLAGLICAKKTRAMAGVDPAVELINCKVMSSSGQLSTTAAVAALRYAIEERVIVVCIPLNMTDFANPEAADDHTEFSRLLQDATEAGIFVTATTSGKADHPAFPGTLPTVCSVTAFSRQYDFSHQASTLMGLADVAVPGEGLWSLHPTISPALGGVRNIPKRKAGEAATAAPSTAAVPRPVPDIGFSRLTGVAMACALFAGFAARMASYHGVVEPQADRQFVTQFSDMLRIGVLNTSVHNHPIREPGILPSLPKQSNGVGEESKTNEKGEEKEEKQEDAEKEVEGPAKLRRSGALQKSTSEMIAATLPRRFFSLNPRYGGRGLGAQDAFLHVRENQKRCDAKSGAPSVSLQPYDVISIPYDEEVETGPHMKPVAALGLLDWALFYFAPYAGADEVVEEALKKAPHSQFLLEALAITLKPGATGQQLRQVLWRALRQAKGTRFEDWTIVPDLTASRVPSLEDFMNSTGPQEKPSRRSRTPQRFLVLLKQSANIASPWEFCRLLTNRYTKVIGDAEPLFMEIETHTNIFYGSSKANEPLYSAEEFLGIETIEEDLSCLGSDVTIAHISDGYQEHECLYRSHMMHNRGWDYVRNEDYADLRDTWLSCRTPDFGETAGALGLATASVLLGISGSASKGVSPHSGIIPIRAVSQRHTDTPAGAYPAHYTSIKSPMRLGHALSHAIRVRADVVIITHTLLCHGYHGFLARLLDLASANNVIVCATVGNGITFKGKMIYPPGGAIGYPARANEVIGVAGCSVEEVPWTFSCRGPQVSTCSLAEYLLVASDSKRESSPGTGLCGGASTAFAAVAIGGVAALFLSVHGKGGMVEAYDKIGMPLHRVFEFILQHAQHTPPSWSYVTCKVFGNGTVKRQARKLLKYPLPTEEELRHFDGARKRVSPRVFMLNFSGDSISVHLKRELIYLYSTCVSLFQGGQKGAAMYQALLSHLSALGAKELRQAIKASPNVTDNKLSIVADGFFVSSQGQVHNIAKKTNMIKKATRDQAPAAAVSAYYPAAPSGAWRSVFYVGMDNEIHQLYWYQSLLHWGMELYYQTLTTPFKNTKAKTVSPVAFYRQDTSHYLVFYVGDQDNRIHVLASASQSLVWKHELLRTVAADGRILFVHPDSVGLERYPSGEHGTCLAFTSLHDASVHHVIVLGTKPCDQQVPHHALDVGMLLK